jgi:opacity protein-like surface antigen
MGAATFTLPALPVKIRADVGYHSNPSADDAVDITENIISVSGDAMFSFAPGPISPYILGGVTWGSASLGGDDAPSTESSTDFGYNIGGGLNFGLGPLKLFAEARWMSIGDADMVPITVGIHF